MDPKEAEALIRRLRAESDHKGADEVQEDLDEWRRKGGF